VEGDTVATNLSLDPELLEKALRVSGEKTKKAAVTKALREFVARHEQRRVSELFGKLQWDASYDYKKSRSRK
jgi:Arc/MetJ family transcription regulator